MNLSPREIDKLLIHVVADLARSRHGRGLKLNYSEAVAMICDAVVEAAREGHTVAEAMEISRTVLSPDDVMPGVREKASLVQVEATFVDGSKLVSCHDPIGGPAA